MIDLQTYRYRVGTFYQKFRPFSNENRANYCKIRQWCWSSSCLCGALFLLMLFSAGLEYNLNYREKNTGSMLIVNELVNEKSLSSFGYSVELVDHNFLARYTYGNKKENGIRLIHWNKGSSFLATKFE